MQNKILVSGVVAMALVVTAGSAFAKGPRMTFEVLDIDGDGKVTLTEITEQRMKEFTSADTDGDGQLSVEEMQAAARVKADERVKNMFEKLDANADGFLSDDELPKPRRASKMFERIDADGDGAITEQEYADAKDRMGRKHKRHHKSDTDNN